MKHNKQLFDADAAHRRVVTAYCACMVSVSLLYVGSGGYMTLTESKWIMQLGLTFGAALLAVALRLELALVGEQPLPSAAAFVRSVTLPEWLLLGYWLACGVSTLLAVDRTVAFWGGIRRQGFVTVTAYCASCLLVARFGRARRWLLYLFGAAMCLHSALCAVQLAGGNPFGLYPAGMNFYDAGKLYSGTFLGSAGNFDMLAALHCLAIPALVAGMIVLRDRKRFWLLIPAIACLALEIRINVDAGTVGLIGCALLSVPALLRGKQAKRRGALASAAVFAVFLAVLYVCGGSWEGFLYETHELMHGRWDDSFGSGRFYIWRKALQLLPDRLLFGGGPDTLSLRSNAGYWYRQRGMEVLYLSRAGAAHSEYLGMLLDQGLVALMFYLAMLAVLLRRWYRAACDDPCCAVCGCAALAYGIQAFFSIPSPATTPLFFLALAFLIGKERTA